MTRGVWNRHLGFLIGLVSALGLLVSACGGDGALGVGDAAPDFSLSAAEGGSVALDGYHDQAVLLYFHMADG
ncbi:MAG: redoxin domain-containing protein [Acidimicrobiales bacterium]|nr:redoxin domain-containing protein [Acidimicrobiales bacterium]NNK91606.1 redoxin domain-containing protein [Acidimicrobiia bacterium]